MSTKTSAQSHSTGATTTTTTTASATTSTKIATNTTATATTVGISTPASASSTTMQAVKIKKELPSDEIKEFAENTMNELLGWYGFDGVDRLDLSAKTSRLLQTAAASANNSMSQHHMEKRRSRSRAVNFFQMQQTEHLRNMANNNNNNNNNNNTNSANNNNNNNNKSNNNNNTRKSAINCNSNRGSSRHESSSSRGGGGGGGGGGGNDSTTSDHDTRSSREDDSKSPHSAGKTTMEEKIDFLNCCWCRRPVPENAPEFLTTTDGPRYCSESCFTQSRRASFKKAKTCDWCKHVRHAVSYVDFQDGASQLQFCSDKCLNQYKMQIFCKETQAHLDMNPHLRDQGMEAAAAGNGAGLITPDLWLRNCRSRSASPASTVSVSPGPPAALLPNMSGALTTSSSSPRITPPSCSTAASAAVPATSSSSHVTGAHKPLISVAPVSKLMSKSASLLSSSSSSNRQSPKHNRKKRPLRSCVSGASAGDLSTGLKTNAAAMARGELNALGAANTSANILAKSKALLNANASSNLRTSPGHMVANNAAAAAGKSTASSLTQFAGSSVQDLHMSVPPLSPMLEQQSHPHPHPHQHTHTHPHPHALAHMTNVGGRGGTSIPPAFFATPSSGQPQHAPPPPPTLSHAAFAPHPPFLPNAAAAAAAAAAAGLLPRFLGAGGGGGGFMGMQQPPPPPHLLQPPDLGGLGLGALLGAPPPVTVMVPYPIIIPLPIPIPVPLPVMDFYKAHLTPQERAKLKEHGSHESKSTTALLTMQHADETPVAERDSEERKASLRTQVEDAADEPLDFTKSKECAATPQQQQQPNTQKPDVPKSDHDLIAASSLEDESTTPVCVERTASEERDASTPTPLSTPLSEDAQSPSPTHAKPMHCIVRTDDDDALLSATGRRDPHTRDDNAPPDESADGSDDAKQKLPKFKITRLQTKRTLIQTKEATAECSRPLRKRKRIIDCDFQKITLKDADADAATEAEAEDAHQLVANTTATAACKTTTGGKKL